MLWCGEPCFARHFSNKGSTVDPQGVHWAHNLERGSGSTLISLLRSISAEHTPGGQQDRAACTGTNKGFK